MTAVVAVEIVPSLPLKMFVPPLLGTGVFTELSKKPLGLRSDHAEAAGEIRASTNRWPIMNDGDPNVEALELFVLEAASEVLSSRRLFLDG